MSRVEGRCAVSTRTTKGRTNKRRATVEARRSGSSVSDPVPRRDRPRKALAQHFLADNRIVLRILAAAELTPQDLVLEIGPGRGVLTRKLVAQAAQVVAVEMDPQLAAALPARMDHPSNLTTVQGDARDIDVTSLLGVDKPYKLVANLPYYAANPIVRRFLETEPKPSLIVVMVQQEVAQAMVAQPGKMSLLSVATQFHAAASRVCTVPPRSFHPPPAVTSAVVRLDVRDRPAVDVRDEGIFFDVVRAGFSARRKQLHNSLAQGLGADREAVARLLAEAGIDGMRRAQTLSLEEWALISEVWGEQSSLEGPGLR